ncbi:RDD family protein [Desulfosediminicola flagellatus]|uniref:RDD family protein n=1 Tax=Desulfosediminicola flagellatus TaxID=2569541 RepID=UPI0010ACD039|nr:RDD family protein [Desulfosediminicola flagellatus]
MSEGKQQRWISGFWRRIIALVIDSILLGIVGQCIGLILETTFVAMGNWGRFVGFFIALAYFGIFNSKLVNGQTFGKKILNIRVVGSNNEPLEVPKSIARYSVLAIPFSLNGMQFPDEFLTSFLIYILAMIVFGGLASVIYLYIFNRVTRQSLHDIAVGSYVVNVGVEQQFVESVWKPHFVIVALFFITAAVVPVFTLNMAEQEPFVNLMASRKALMEYPSVQFAGVSYGKSIFTSSDSGTTETTYTSAKVTLLKNDIANEELARLLAISIVDNYPESIQKDVMQIHLVYGFDIGIASRWNTHSHRFNPRELRSERSPVAVDSIGTDVDHSTPQ